MMMAPQNQMAPQMAPQNQFNTFSAAASVAPIILWSGQTQQGAAGNVYLSAKNTFLEFYTDEKKAIKRSAAARSASCDSTITADRSSGKSTAEPTTRSPSPTNRSSASSGRKSPDTTPRTDNNYQYVHANYNDDAAYFSTHYQHHDAQYYNDASYDGCPEYYGNAGYVNYSGGQDNCEGGYPMMMVPMMMMPMGMKSRGDEQKQEMVQPRGRLPASRNLLQPEPQVVKPRIG